MEGALETGFELDLTMLSLAKKLLRSFGIDTWRLYQKIQRASIEAAAREQNLVVLRDRLRRAIPDVSDQYSFDLDPGEFGAYWEAKMRTLHAFQIDCALKAVADIPGDNLTIIDIGDSSGNHGAYLKAVAPVGKIGRMLSVNIDPIAVEKVRAKGGEAVLCRAEDLADQSIRPDLFMTFEMMEHLRDPLGFLRAIATKCPAPILISVPFRRNSRFGGLKLRLARSGSNAPLTPESVHLLELSPDDWKLLFLLAGFRVEADYIYRQYPKYHPLYVTRPLWAQTDFEGFAVFRCQPDTRVSDLYTGW